MHTKHTLPQSSSDRCDMCGHVVKTMHSIRHHLRRQHPEANEFTFSKLTLGSQMRPPIKHPYKCNYCGDVGETLQEMNTHHAFLHSHLECSITNLMDEALSSVHSSSTTHSSGELKSSQSAIAVSTANKCSPAHNSEPDNSKSSEPKCVLEKKNTARKSMPLPLKRTVAMKSTARQHIGKPVCVAEDGTYSFYKAPQSPIHNDNIYAFLSLGAGVPVRLTMQQLERLFDLRPQVKLSDVNVVKNSENTWKLTADTCI